MKNEYLEPLWEALNAFAEYPAIVDKSGQRQTSYAELKTLVCRVVAWLDAQGIAPASFVPIVLPSSMEYYAAEIGIWMAGHSSVPMGTAFPPDRIAYIMEHCEAPLCIDEAAWEEILVTPPREFEGGAPDYPDEDVPALLIYTSGSTGAPKGIIHTFGGLAVKHTAKVALVYTTDDHWAMGAPPYFVASLTAFKLLKEGGQLHLIAPEMFHDISAFEDYIVDAKITFTFMSPSMLRQFHNRSDTLKVVFTGSERLSGMCSKEGYKLINCFGMSETAGTVTAYPVMQPYDTTPVGKPEEKWALLDEDGNPVPEGEEGEFCLSGKYCKGYYKDPERTAELYRGGWLHTGDILRQLPDGNLVYVNRKDWMAKINGQRVEPGEVEEACRKLDGVEMAVVKAFDREESGQYLCAFYIGDADPEALRESLAAKLPPYMVPSFFVPVREFALLPNGKINRKVLASPDIATMRSSYEPPQTELESRLCDAYAQIFELEQVGALDDFFLLGGDSIRVMKLQQLMGDLPLTAKMVQEARTPRSLAQAIQEAAGSGEGADVGYVFEGSGTKPCPLTQTQLGIYTESVARAGEAVYNNPVLLRLDPAIDPDRLARALEAAVEAHPFVKIRIQEDDEGNPLMVPGGGTYTQVVERMSDKELEALKPQLTQPFDLHEGPLFRIRVIVTPTAPYLFTDFQHIIYDGTSARIFMADVADAYEGASVEPERVSGFDVALREQALRASDSYERSREYYESTFGSLDLDTTPEPDCHGDEVTYAIVQRELAVGACAVKAFCTRLGITQNVLALGAFGKLMAAYAHTDESSFTTIYNGRSDFATSRTVDMMVKTLPVYCKADPSQRVPDYLYGIKEQVMSSMANDIYSFAELSASTGFSSDVLFAYQGDYLALGTVCGKPYERVELGGNATGSPLGLQLFKGPDGFVLRAEFQSNRYSERFVTNLVTSFDAVMQSMLSAEHLAEVELVDAAQLELLESFQGREVAYDTTQTIVSLFGQTASLYPENIAAVYKDERLSFAKADQLATALARHIRARIDPQPGDVVSILIPRGLLMPVASLAALKAGCAYQPLDPTYPPERLNFMVKDANARLLISSPELCDIVSEYDGEVIELGSVDDIAGLGAPPQVELPAPSPEDLFVLLYTSGTTGVPKGVRLTHANLACFVGWYQRFYGLGPQHRVCAYASYGFDACMMDMYPALTCGAGVVIVPEEIRLDLVALGDYYERNGVTHAFMTTQVGRQFALLGSCSTLQYLSMGGETLVPFDLDASFPVVNLYGPSECTVLVTAYQLQGGEKSYPIGHLIDNVRGYIVDGNGNRVPPGAAGELWLAGTQVADGYLNRPDKTAEAFGTDPFDAAHQPLYRTGDIVRWSQDGLVEFMGRRDGQVKIRGFRIELTEVEAVVREFPGVTDATVAAFDHPNGGKFVAAYVVGDGEISSAELADFIRERKPPYMVPAAIMQVDAIPLNQNGKVNRRALPEPTLVEADESAEDESRPMNALERELHAIVEDIVGTDAFGVSTPLDHCGMTSVQSIRLLALVYKRFGVSIHAHDLDDQTSIATLEDMILGAWMSGERPGAAADEAAEPEELHAPLTFAQMGVYYECLKAPDSLAYNIPSDIEFADGVTPDAVTDAVRKVVAAHPVLSSCFVREGEDVYLVPSQEEPAVEHVSCNEEEFADVRQRFVAPFDLATGPLARFAVVTAGTTVHLLSDFHHLAFDGASTGIFLADLTAALGGGSPVRETYTYSAFANDQAAFAKTDGFEANRAFFADMLKDYESATELAPDMGGKRRAGRQRTAAAALDLAAVESASQDMGVTPAALMLAASSYALARYCSERTVYAATISNGRGDVRTADTVGMFVNTLPLAVTVGDEDASAFVASCAKTLAGAIEHEAYPFAAIASDYGFAPNIVYEYQVGAVELDGVGTSASIAGISGILANEAKFKLSVHIEMADGAPAVVVYYNDALYSEGLAQSLADSIVIAARALIKDPTAPVRSISLLDDARRAQLEDMHQEATGPIDFDLLHEALEAQADRTPDALALVAADASLTYAELDERANRIAHALIDKGVPPQSRVALLLPRTSDVIVAMFGVCKAGCAYIPCDRAYPAERIEHILTDSGAEVVITTADKSTEVRGAVDIAELLAHPDGTRPAVDVGPDDLAYLIYTSGSTGKPKGVMLTHRGVCNFNSRHPSNVLVDALVGKARAFLSVTTLSFDMSVKETLTPLVNGVTLVLADESQVNDPAKLADLFAATGADAFNATHSRLRQYLESPSFVEAIAHAKVIASGGEKYTDGLLPLLQRSTEARIINTYGPTETCVSSNMKDLTHETAISVGRPLYNVWECVVDADGNELPVGVVGELLIGGPGVARGYNNLPDKTAEAFVERDGMRCYRSGDYARMLPSGDVEILGRTDTQVKLRGLRIEIGEVEAALAAVPKVSAGAVRIARIGGVEHLCAYFSATERLDVADVRGAMAESLAAYMVPSAFKQLDAMPMTPNGKVDYRALPVAELFRSSGMVQATNETEAAFCSIFGEILGLDEVGATDSFFDIGGTSLMAIRITVEAEKRGWQVSYADVFANPTPRGLAAVCGEAGPDEAGGAAAEDSEISDFDYEAIDELLSNNNLRTFAEGERRPLGNILLAGAVGYLGIHILREYLENYSGTAYCLVRPHKTVSAKMRLKYQLFYYFEKDYAELFGSRIVVIEGDVTNDINLPDDARVDTVINCAAVVKHFSVGTEIEDVNVGGAAKLVDFCLDKGAALVQISTGSTMKCPLRSGVDFVGKTTERHLYVGQDLQNKYTRSKFLSERLVLDAVARKGLVGKVMRVGNLAPRAGDGEFQINYDTNAAMGRLKSYAMLGCVPYGQLDATMEFSPIDQTARAILLLAQSPDGCVVFHPINHHKVFMSDVFEAMRESGLDVEPVERDVFVRELRTAEADPAKARVLTSMLAYAGKAKGAPVVTPVIDNGYTMQVLYRLGFRWSATSISYVEQFLGALEGLGFFDEEEEEE